MNIEEIKALAKEYSVEVEQKGNGEILYLKSKGNTWYFYLKDVPNNINERGTIYLFHKCNSKVKEHYHTQRKYSFLFQLFDSISSHDQHMFVQRKKSRMELLFDKIETQKDSKLHNNERNSKNKQDNLSRKSKHVS